MDDFARGTVEVALRKMFQADGYLNICTVDQLVKVTGVVPPAPEYAAMRLLHCIHWREMPEAVRDEAARRLMSWFALPPFDPWAVQVSVSTPRAGALGRLLGRGQ